MKHPIVIGLQFGDEGKGKVTDLFAEKADWVIRFNGGNNAGHSLEAGGVKIVTHSVPSGILYQHTKNYIGCGCVVDPVSLAEEISMIEEAGFQVSPENLKIDHRVHLTLPIHRALDCAREQGDGAVGSTKRGIGPVYGAKFERRGLRAGDWSSDEETVKKRLEALCEYYNPCLLSLGQLESTVEENWKVFLESRKRFGDYVCYDHAPFYVESKSKKCLMEGAQALLLDIDHGTYPFVTSSNSVGSYASVGTPFPHSKMGPTIGVAKAYLTRVGEGPMPSEFDGEEAEDLRKRGQEFGATTGRPRRVGALDLDALKQAVQVADCQYLVITKADILNGQNEFKYFKNSQFHVHSGWEKIGEDVSSLDANFRSYIEMIEAHVGVPVLAVGTGAGRNEILWLKNSDILWKE